MPPDRIAAIESNAKLKLVGGPIVNIRPTIFDKHYPILLADWTPPAFDPAKAKKFLDGAGYGGAAIPHQMLSNHYIN